MHSGATADELVAEGSAEVLGAAVVVVAAADVGAAELAGASDVASVVGVLEVTSDDGAAGVVCACVPPVSHELIVRASDAAKAMASQDFALLERAAKGLPREIFPVPDAFDAGALLFSLAAWLLREALIATLFLSAEL